MNARLLAAALRALADAVEAPDDAERPPARAAKSRRQPRRLSAIHVDPAITVDEVAAARARKALAGDR